MKETKIREGEQSIVRDIRDQVITLVRPKKTGGIEQYRGVWKSEEADKVFKEISKQWKSWGTFK